MAQETEAMPPQRPKGRVIQFQPHFDRKRGARPLPKDPRLAGLDTGQARELVRQAVQAARNDFPFEEEAARAKGLFDWGSAYVRHVWSAAESGKQVDCLEAGLLIEELYASITRNSAAVASLTRFSRAQDYGHNHAVNTAVLSMMCGRSLGMPRPEIICMGLAGMHLDLGMARMPTYIIDKPGRLKTWEYALLKQHAAEGCKVLRGGGEVRDQVQKAILDHHERHDGLGYPHGIRGRSISQGGRIVALADAFDAMTSERAYREAFSPTRALGFIYQQAGRQFHPSVAQWFVRSMGVYPPGSLVLLNDGRLAVVRSLRRAQPLRPEIMVIFDSQCKPCPPQLLDLGEEAQTGVMILRCLEPRRFGLEPAALYSLAVQGMAAGQS